MKWLRHSPERNRVAASIREQRNMLRSYAAVASYEIERAEDRLAWNRVEAKALRNEESYLRWCMERRILAKLTRTEVEEPYSIERQRRAWATEIRDARYPYSGRHPWSYSDEDKARAYLLARNLRAMARRQIARVA